jgi:hypothetical protein
METCSLPVIDTPLRFVTDKRTQPVLNWVLQSLHNTYLMIQTHALFPLLPNHR